MWIYPDHVFCASNTCFCHVHKCDEFFGQYFKIHNLSIFQVRPSQKILDSTLDWSIKADSFTRISGVGWGWEPNADQKSIHHDLQLLDHLILRRLNQARTAHHFVPSTGVWRIRMDNNEISIGACFVTKHWDKMSMDFIVSTFLFHWSYYVISS